MAVNKIQNIGGREGRVTLVDANPNLLTGHTLAEEANVENFTTFMYTRSKTESLWGCNKILVCGYKQIKAWTEVPAYISSYMFQYTDGTFSSEIPSVNGWTDWIDIPQNAQYIIANGTSTGPAQYANINFSLKA